MYKSTILFIHCKLNSRTYLNIYTKFTGQAPILPNIRTNTFYHIYNVTQHSLKSWSIMVIKYDVIDFFVWVFKSTSPVSIYLVHSKPQEVSWLKAVKQIVITSNLNTLPLEQYANVVHFHYPKHLKWLIYEIFNVGEIEYLHLWSSK